MGQPNNLSNKRFIHNTTSTKNDLNNLNQNISSTKCNIVSPIKSYINAEQLKKIILKENNNKSGVYRWVNNFNQKSYIGSGVNLGKRLGSYFNESELNRNSRPIKDALIKYGHMEFTLDILEYCPKSELINREQYYIDILNPEYNILKTAYSILGYRHSPENIEKFKSKIISQEHKEILSLTHKNKLVSEETRNKLSEATANYKKNNKLTPESLAKIRAKTLEREGVPVKVLNTQTNDLKEFTNQTEAGEFLGVSRQGIYNAIKRNKPIKKIYIISSDYLLNKVISQRKNFKLIDYSPPLNNMLLNKINFELNQIKNNLINLENQIFNKPLSLVVYNPNQFSIIKFSTKKLDWNQTQLTMLLSFLASSNSLKIDGLSLFEKIKIKFSCAREQFKFKDFILKFLHWLKSYILKLIKRYTIKQILIYSYEFLSFYIWLVFEPISILFGFIVEFFALFVKIYSFLKIYYNNINNIFTYATLNRGFFPVYLSIVPDGMYDRESLLKDRKKIYCREKTMQSCIDDWINKGKYNIFVYFNKPSDHESLFYELFDNNLKFDKLTQKYLTRLFSDVNVTDRYKAYSYKIENFRYETQNYLKNISEQAELLEMKKAFGNQYQVDIDTLKDLAYEALRNYYDKTESYKKTIEQPWRSKIIEAMFVPSGSNNTTENWLNISAVRATSPDLERLTNTPRPRTPIVEAVAELSSNSQIPMTERVKSPILEAVAESSHSKFAKTKAINSNLCGVGESSIISGQGESSNNTNDFSKKRKKTWIESFSVEESSNSISNNESGNINKATVKIKAIIKRSKLFTDNNSN